MYQYNNVKDARQILHNNIENCPPTEHSLEKDRRSSTAEQVRSSYVEAHCRASKKLSFDAL